MLRLTDRYRAVIFDVGGTLLDVDGNPLARALQQVAPWGAPPPFETFETELRRVVIDWQRAGGPDHAEDLASTWEAHYRMTLAALAFAGDVPAAAAAMEHAFLRDGWRLFPDSVEVIQQLGRTGIKLGVLSNWPASLAATLAQLGLAASFDAIVASADVGYAKPHAQGFHTVLQRLAVAPSDALYVGDSLEHDIVGARRAGLDAILLDRGDRHPDHRPRLRTLSDLLTWSSQATTA